MAKETITRAPVEALRAEMTDEPISVEFNGDDYLIERDVLTSIDFLEAAQDGKDAQMVRALLGPVQWIMFKNKNKQRSSLMDIASAIGEAIEAGN